MPEVWVACAESPRGMIPQQGRAASRGIGGDGADEGAQEGSKATLPAASQPVLSQDVDTGELLYLVLRFLGAASPAFQQGVALLEAAASQLQLLPRRIDAQGQEHACSVDELAQLKLAHVPADALPRMLGHLLGQLRAASLPGAQGLTSLLAPGRLSPLSLPQLHPSPHPHSAATPQAAQLHPGTGAQRTSQAGPLALLSRTHGETNAVGLGLPPAFKPWAVPPHSSAPRMASLMLRSLGVCCAPRAAGGSAAGVRPGSLHSTEMLGRSIRHVRTLRGHKLAVYCLAYTRDGRYIVSGSDDWLVKIWCARTGRMLATCRGHEQEINDLAVNAPGTLAASACNDKVIRVWSLQEGTVGHPVSVLVGHEAAVTFVGFNDAVPGGAVLLSSSWDGTCRIWNALDGSQLPIVLRTTAGTFVGLGTSAAPPFARHPPTARAVGIPVQPWEEEEWAEGGPTMPATKGDLSGHSTAQNSTAAKTAQQGSLQQRPGGASTGANQEGGAQGQMDAEEGPPTGDAAVGLICCRWSPDGATILAGGYDWACYVWHWDVDALLKSAASGLQAPAETSGSGAGVQAAREEQQQQPHADGPGISNLNTSQAAQALSNAAAAAAAAVAAAALPIGPVVDWPQPVEVARLEGHKRDINFMLFDGAGHRVATGAKDGQVKIWHQRRSQRTGRWLKGWVEHVTCVCTPDPAAEAALAGGRKSARRVQQVPSVNQLAWTRDDSKVVAVVSDKTLRVWDAHTGAALHLLRGHTQEPPVLEAHPQDPRLVMSVGYDGLTILWDVQQGVLLRSFSTLDTFPVGRGRWTDPTQLLDAHWTPDGAGIIASDTAGQLHIYAAGPVSESLRRAPYDQFLSSDYSPLMRDLTQWVIDTESQRPPHLIPNQRLVNIFGDPYDQPVQDAYRQGKFSTGLPKPRRRDPLPAGLVSLPPTATSAAWAAHRSGASAHALAQAGERAQTRHRQALDVLLGRVRLPSATPPAWPPASAGGQQAGAEQHPDAHLWAYIGGTRTGTEQQHYDDWSDSEDTGPVLLHTTSTSQHSIHLTDDEGIDMPAAEGTGEPGSRRQRSASAPAGAAAQGGGDGQQPPSTGVGIAAGRRQGDHQEEASHALDDDEGAEGFQGPGTGTASTREGRRLLRNSRRDGTADGSQTSAERARAQRLRHSARLTGSRGTMQFVDWSSSDEGSEDRGRATSDEDFRGSGSEGESEENSDWSDSDLSGDSAGFDSDGSGEGGRRSSRQREHRHSGRRDGKRRRRGDGYDDDEEARHRPTAPIEPSTRVLRSRRGDAAEGGGRHGRSRGRGAGSEGAGDEGYQDYVYYPEDGIEGDNDEVEDEAAVKRRRGGRKAPPGRRQQPQQRADEWRARLSRPAEDAQGLQGAGAGASAGAQAGIPGGVEGQPDKQGATPGGGQQGKQQKRPRSKRMDDWDNNGRSQAMYEWLRVSTHVPGCYVPQAGDEVVYLRGGHQIYLDTVQNQGGGSSSSRSLPSAWDVLSAKVQELLDARSNIPAVDPSTLIGPDGWIDASAAARAGQAAAEVERVNQELRQWRMRPAEPCKVTRLMYKIAGDGTTIARLELELLQCPELLRGSPFLVDLPNPSAGHAEFVLLRSRYDASAGRAWSLGEHCKCYQMEEGGGGNWWEAVVIEDSMLIKAQDAAPGHGNNKPQDADLTGQQQQVEVPSGEAQPGASTQLQQGLTKSEAGGVKVEQVVLSVMAQQAVQWPVKYEEEGLWERYLVRWVDEQEEEVDGGTRLCPWEMVDTGMSWEQVTEVDPRLSPEEHAAATRALEGVLKGGLAYDDERFHVFVDTPGPKAAFVLKHGKQSTRVHYNARVPLPLSLADIYERLHSAYYRSMDALRHDMETIVSNAEAFHGHGSAFAQDAGFLRDTFVALLEGNQLPAPPKEPEEEYQQQMMGEGTASRRSRGRRNASGGGAGDTAFPRLANGGSGDHAAGAAGAGGVPGTMGGSTTGRRRGGRYNEDEFVSSAPGDDSEDSEGQDGIPVSEDEDSEYDVRQDSDYEALVEKEKQSRGSRRSTRHGRAVSNEDEVSDSGEDWFGPRKRKGGTAAKGTAPGSGRSAGGHKSGGSGRRSGSRQQQRSSSGRGQQRAGGSSSKRKRGRDDSSEEEEEMEMEESDSEFEGGGSSDSGFGGGRSKRSKTSSRRRGAALAPAPPPPASGPGRHSSRAAAAGSARRQYQGLESNDGDAGVVEYGLPVAHVQPAGPVQYPTQQYNAPHMPYNQPQPYFGPQDQDEEVDGMTPEEAMAAAAKAASDAEALLAQLEGQQMGAGQDGAMGSGAGIPPWPGFMPGGVQGWDGGSRVAAALPDLVPGFSGQMLQPPQQGNMEPFSLAGAGSMVGDVLSQLQALGGAAVGAAGDGNAGMGLSGFAMLGAQQGNAANPGFMWPNVADDY